MKIIIISFAILLLATYSGISKEKNPSQKINSSSHQDVKDNSYRDIFPDTWVGTDDLGRKVPDWQKVGLVKTNGQHAVGIFYVTWHGDNLYKSKAPYSGDVSKILKKDPSARLDAKNKLWQYGPYHWAEPELGYFLSKDKFVIWRDLSMLADAGVDVIILDVTNGNSYWEAWDVIFEVMEQMSKLGNKVPKFCFWTWNKDVITVVQNIYDKIYKPGKHKKFWFYWNEKPLLLYRSKQCLDLKIKNKNPHYDPKAKTDKSNPHYGDSDYTEEYYKDYSKEVKNFFTRRNMWWGYYEWHEKRYIGTEDNWSFGYDLTNPKVNKMSPMEMVSKHNGKPEEAAVTPAQHATTKVGKSWTRENGEPELNEYDLPVKTFVPWLGKKVENPEAYGIYFQKRWDEALEVNPSFIYLNDWNEWIAGKYHPEKGKTTKFMDRDNTYFFVDQYNEEFNRGIQPMKDGYTDNYYMQMIENIRKYKGARKFPVINKYKNITIDGLFDDWEKVKVEFRDTVGDTVYRDYKGYGGLHYKENSGRNDIITCKVAVSPKNIYFMAETQDSLTSPSGKNWMLLLIDADKNPETGWHGYDFLINKKRKGNKLTTLQKYNSKLKVWENYLDIPYRFAGNKIELSVLREKLNLSKNNITFDFHWADNPENLESIIDFCTTGDSAPNRRFNYRSSVLVPKSE